MQYTLKDLFEDISESYEYASNRPTVPANLGQTILLGTSGVLVITVFPTPGNASAVLHGSSIDIREYTDAAHKMPNSAANEYYLLIELVDKALQDHQTAVDCGKEGELAVVLFEYDE